MQHRGIGQQLQRSSSGSTPHDRITIPQICSARSLAPNRPRQPARRYPAVASNRPTVHHVRRDPPPINKSRHRRTTCWIGSIPYQPAHPRHSNPHSARGTALRSLTRGFLPWRLSDAGRRTRGAVSQAAGIRNPSQCRKCPEKFWPCFRTSLPTRFSPEPERCTVNAELRPHARLRYVSWGRRCILS